MTEATTRTHQRIFLFFAGMIFVFLVVLGALFVSHEFAFAQGENDTFGIQEVDDTVTLGSDDIRVVIARIIRAVLGLLGLVTVGIIIYGGFLIMTSGGKEDQIERGRRTLTNAVIGLIIILSSLAIVQFLLNSFSQGTFGPGGPGVSGPGGDNFAGSGALGEVVKDHYPFRDQTGVARNASIVVTFFDAVDPSSVINNSNETCWPADGSGIAIPIGDGSACEKNADGTNREFFGDCTVPEGEVWDWDFCDTLNQASIQVFASANGDDFGFAIDDSVLLGGAAVANYEQEDQVFSFVFTPYQTLGEGEDVQKLWALGSDTEDVWYSVILTDNIKKAVLDESVFTGQSQPYYLWEFQTNTEFDFTPPYVISTAPAAGGTIARNSILQINFSEPVSPIGVQGAVGPDSPFSNIIFDDIIGADGSSDGVHTSGFWKLTNGYKTAQFISDVECGVINSCGEPMYCLVLEECQGADSNNPACVQTFDTLLRTADLLDPLLNNFQAIPFSGIMDMANNALDDDEAGELAAVQGMDWLHKPPFGEFGPKDIGPLEQNPDNHSFSFTVENKLDLTIPHIMFIEPAVDEVNVSPSTTVGLAFSKAMDFDGMYYIDIQEYGPDIGIPQPWTVPESITTDGPLGLQTATEIQHREFGPNNTDFYYFTKLPSNKLKSLNQQCFYPGRGPDTKDGYQCTTVENDQGVVTDSFGCVPVTFEADFDTGCATGDEYGNIPHATSNVETCTQALEQFSDYTNF